MDIMQMTCSEMKLSLLILFSLLSIDRAKVLVGSRFV